MTRKKKIRTGGPLAAAKKQREGDSNNVSKGKKVGKGRASGSRHSAVESKKSSQSAESRDKRTGSKKPISLTATAPTKQVSKETKPQADWPPTSDKAMQQALLALEQDSQFMAQLDKLEQGGVLPADQQDQFGVKLERYDWLLEQLDPEDDDDDWDDLSDQGKSLKDEWL